jgi:hypothetical protein
MADAVCRVLDRRPEDRGRITRRITARQG